MSLPWVRLDANIGTHDKTLELLDHKDGTRAFTLYVCSIGWAGGHGTDGLIPKHALRAIAPSLRTPEKLAQLLVDVRLWEYVEGGWQIRNYLERQQSSIVSEAVSAQKSAAARKANCIRWHGSDCGCWSSQTGSQTGSHERSYVRTDVLTENLKDSQRIVDLRYAREAGGG
jgi:hypothetical protein